MVQHRLGASWLPEVSGKMGGDPLAGFKVSIRKVTMRGRPEPPIAILVARAVGLPHPEPATLPRAAPGRPRRRLEVRARGGP